MNDKIAKLSQIVDILVKFEVHAFIMAALGCLLVIKGFKDEGNLVLGAALVVFRGNR